MKVDYQSDAEVSEMNPMFARIPTVDEEDGVKRATFLVHCPDVRLASEMVVSFNRHRLEWTPTEKRWSEMSAAERKKEIRNAK